MDNQPKIDEKEIQIIKTYFAENDALLQSMRALFFNLDVTDADRKAIQETFKSEDLVKVVKKRFLPELERDTPIGHVQDIWLGTEKMILGANTDTIKQVREFKKELISMVRAALELLKNPYGEPVDITYDPDEDLSNYLATNLLARNQYIHHIEQQLLFLKVIAGTKQETPEQAKERLLKNSNK